MCYSSVCLNVRQSSGSIVPLSVIVVTFSVTVDVVPFSIVDVVPFSVTVDFVPFSVTVDVEPWILVAVVVSAWVIKLPP